jgi:hypothetical protein
MSFFNGRSNVLDILFVDIPLGPLRKSQVLAASECNFMDTPARCATREFSPGSKLRRHPRGAPRKAGPPARRACRSNSMRVQS